MKSCNMGGQAVIEGVMMRYRSNIAVSVRKPDGGIAVGKMKYASFTAKHPILRWPIIRGVVAFIDSLVLGIKTLMFSASIFEEDIAAGGDGMEAAAAAGAEAEKNGNSADKLEEKELKNSFKSKGEAALMTGTMLFSLVIALALFVALPYFISHFILKNTGLADSSVLLAIIEGVLKLLIFVGYIAAISRMKDIKRTFMYHGAEHKSINCIESGLELNVDNVMKSSKEHRRCGTSFICLVLIISIIFFIFIRVKSWPLRLLIRLLLMPVVAGVSYEAIQWAGNTENKLAYIMSKPGLWIQKLTTSEPTRDMVEVAIASVEAVFNWKKYQEDEKNGVNCGSCKTSSKKKFREKDPYEVDMNLGNDKQSVSNISAPEFEEDIVVAEPANEEGKARKIIDENGDEKWIVE